MNILITGSKGQLGNELRLLSEKYTQHNFFLTDIEELDITNKDAVNAFVADNNINLLINCAAFTAVDRAESQQELCHLLNAEAPGILAKAMQQAGGWMIQISTDYVFEGTGHKPYTEDLPTNPQSIYGKTKLLGEQAVMRECPESIIIRTAWLYSTFGNNFVKTMLRLGKERESLGVIFDQIGTPTYAADLAEAIMHIAEAESHSQVAQSENHTPGIYHYSNEGVCSWYDFTREIHHLAGITSCDVKPLHTEEYPTPAPRPMYSVLDKTKIKQTYGISIPWWQDSLAKCISKILSETK